MSRNLRSTDHVSVSLIPGFVALNLSNVVITLDGVSLSTTSTADGFTGAIASALPDGNHAVNVSATWNGKIAYVSWWFSINSSIPALFPQFPSPGSIVKENLDHASAVVSPAVPEQDVVAIAALLDGYPRASSYSNGVVTVDLNGVDMGYHEVMVSLNTTELCLTTEWNFSLEITFGDYHGKVLSEYGRVINAWTQLDGSSPDNCYEGGSLGYGLRLGEHNITVGATDFISQRISVNVTDGSSHDLGIFRLKTDPGALGLQLYQYSSEFSLLLPSSWKKEENVTFSGNEFDVMATGPTLDGVTANINVKMGYDPTVVESAAYLMNLGNQTLSKLMASNPLFSLYEPQTITMVNGHMATIFALSYNAQQLVIVQGCIADGSNHTAVVVTATVGGADYQSYAPLLNEVVRSVNIIGRASAPSGDVTVNGLLLAGCIGAVAGVSGVAVALAIRAKKGTK